MASFTTTYSEYLGGNNGKSAVLLQGTLTLSAEGGTVGDIPASTFGSYTKIRMVTPAVLSDNSQVHLFGIVADASGLVSIDIEDATDTDRANPADLTGDFVLTLIVQ